MKRKNIYIILLLSMFALTSCKVGKSYVRPGIAFASSGRLAAAKTQYGDDKVV